MKTNLRVTTLILAFTAGITASVSAQKFIHPGIDQTAEDMAFMKKQVLAGAQPWKDAFERLKAATDLNSEIIPFTHVQRGPYGRPNIGGGELDRNANLAYNCALLWYITENDSYAKKAIEILNKWSPVLWDFDYNDAKLLAAWTGHVLCNTAELLKYTNSGWQQKDIDSFTNMLMTVYYPLLRFYYPSANGNWDGAIIHSILAIAIFTDNRNMFDNAIDHFLHGPVNGSIFKYIYPSGQCQESTRDQGHVQLGLGEFAGAARVAFTQGVDLFSAGDNRIALGYEYTAKFLLGEKPQCYGIISERAKKIRDDYEYVYRHYASKGLSIPYIKIAADSARPASTRNTLTAFRAGYSIAESVYDEPKPSMTGYPAGALTKVSTSPPAGSVYVNPGESLQDALNSVAGTNKWVVAKSGIHTLPGTLKIPDEVTLAGEGLGTTLFLSPSSGVRDALANSEPTMHDVTIRDLLIEGNIRTDPGTDPNSTRSYRNPGNRGGIIFLANHEGEMRNVNLINVTVQNCTYNGVFMNGIAGLNIINCNFTECGSSVVPGPKLQHNLLITHCSDIVVRDSRLDTSPFGSGIAIEHCTLAKVTNCEVARNAYYGILISESKEIIITGNLIEANDRSGIMAEYLHNGSQNISIRNNKIQYNNGFAVESYAVNKITVNDNIYTGNGNTNNQLAIRNDAHIIME